MENSRSDKFRFRRNSAATCFGLSIALFGMLIIRAAVYACYPPFSFQAAVWRESLNLVCAVTLLVVIRLGERLPLRSIGFGRATVLQSVGWGVLICIVCAVLGAILVAVTHFTGGSSGAALSKLPLWLVTIIVLRAGVVEELFYRGYAIERLQALGLSPIWAGAIPLVIFSVAHWTGGWANILIAIVLGATLTLFYMWRRDLLANMIGHFLVDFIANVLPKLG